MNQTERRIFLIKYLLAEHPNLQQEIPEDGTDQIRMLRGLMNIRNIMIVYMSSWVGFP